MEQRLSLITLGVADLTVSTAFYERLGWRPPARRLEGVTFFQAGCMILALYPREALAEDTGLATAGSGFGGIVLAYNTRSQAEVDAVLDQAVAAGAGLLRPAQQTFWGGYAGAFADPDGHPWEVAWNPDFPMAADGSIRLPG